MARIPALGDLKSFQGSVLAMKPGKYDPPVIWRGCDWLPITLIWKDQNGNPINLSGLTPYAQSVDGLSLNPVVTDEANGVTQMSLPKSQTGNLKLGKIAWDWVWWDNVPIGTKYPPMLHGTLTIKQPDTQNFISP